MALLLLCQLHSLYDQCSATGSLTVFELQVYLEAEKRKTAAEDKRRKAAQLAEDVINAGQKADDLSRKMHDVEPQERDQLSEQDIAQRLIMKLPVNFLQL